LSLFENDKLYNKYFLHGKYIFKLEASTIFCYTKLSSSFSYMPHCIGDQFTLCYIKRSVVEIHYIKEEKTRGSFSRIHESLKSTVTLRLIFGARPSRPLLRSLEIVYSSTHRRQIKLSRHIDFFSFFICTRGIVVTVKIKSLRYLHEILFPRRILAAVCFVQHPRASIDILILMQQMHPE